jgi:hypothetical protein
MATNVITYTGGIFNTYGLYTGAVLGNYVYSVLGGTTIISQFSLTGQMVNQNWADLSSLIDGTNLNNNGSIRMSTYQNYIFIANSQNKAFRLTVNPDGSYVPSSAKIWLDGFYLAPSGLNKIWPADFVFVGQTAYMVSRNNNIGNTSSIYAINMDASGNALDPSGNPTLSNGQFSQQNFFYPSLYNTVQANSQGQTDRIEAITYHNSKIYIGVNHGSTSNIFEMNSDFTLTSGNTAAGASGNPVSPVSWYSTNNFTINSIRFSGSYAYLSLSNRAIRQLNLDGTVANATWYQSTAQIGTIAISDSYVYGFHGFIFEVIPLPPPPIQYARMRINYSSIVNGNPVGGLVFEGYYSYQTNNNRVISLYSSSDLTTNLLIPSTDPFVSGALTLLGKSTSNTAGSSGIDTTASHAGVFVKNLPFVNALFKSNPYVVLKPSEMVMFDNYGAVNENVLATSYFANKYVMSNGNVYSNKNNSFFSFSNFTFTYNTVSAIPTVNVPPAIDYTFFNSISQIVYTAKYNGAVVLDSYFVFYLDRFNNYHMCAQYVKTETKNLLVYSDESCDNFPITRDFGNSAGTQSTSSSDNTITETSGEAENATVTTFDVNETGTSTVLETINVVGETRTVNLNALNSNICFSEGSIVSTDQGEVEIQNIDIHYHTIHNNKIIALTETQSIDNYLVKIKKNAFGLVPTQDTEMTGNHMIFNNGFIQAKTLINGTTVEKIPYRGLPLYNILLETHDIMSVNGLITETLNPENPIAKYYTMMEKKPENKVEMENMWRKRTQEIIHSC